MTSPHEGPADEAAAEDITPSAEAPTGPLETGDDDVTPDTAADHEIHNAEAMSRMFTRMALALAVFLLVLAAVSIPIGWFAAGWPGVWGAVLGVAITLTFVVSTALLGRITATQPTWVASAALLGVWLLKMVIILVVIVVVRDMDFYHPLALFGTVVAAIIGTTIIEVREASRARVLYTTPGAK